MSKQFGLFLDVSGLHSLLFSSEEYLFTTNVACFNAELIPGQLELGPKSGSKECPDRSKTQISSVFLSMKFRHTLHRIFVFSKRYSLLETTGFDFSPIFNCTDEEIVNMFSLVSIGGFT